jgi:hypothetical protein
MITVTDHVKTLIPPRLFPAARKLYWWLRDQKLYRWFRVLPYMGNQVYCPCCDSDFRCFIPCGSPPHQNGICPRCDALNRHRLLWLYLHNCTNLFHDRLRVLHFAPEVIIQKRLRACPNLDYTSADLDSPFAMVRMDITQIPYAENTVDIILCSHILEHIPDDHKAMTELYRILKSGGWAIIQVPIIDPERAETFEAPDVVDPRERYRLFGQADHVRIYGHDFKNRLERSGFTVQQNFYALELGPALTQRYGLLEEEDMFYCTKTTKPAPDKEEPIYVRQ